MLNYLSLGKESSTYLLNYTKFYLPIVEESNYEDINLDIIIARLRQNAETMQQMLNVAEREVLTRRIAEADEEQDFSFLFLRNRLEGVYLAKGGKNDPDADLLMKAVQDAGYSLQNYGYRRQEAALHKLLEDLSQSSRLKEAVENLKLGEQVSDLRGKFEEFKRLRNERRHKRIDKANNKSFTEVRRDLIDQIRRSSNIIDNAYYARPDDEDIKVLVYRINELNASERSLIKAEETRRSNEDKNPADGDTQDQ